MTIQHAMLLVISMLFGGTALRSGYSISSLKDAHSARACASVVVVVGGMALDIALHTVAQPDVKGASYITRIKKVMQALAVRKNWGNLALAFYRSLKGKKTPEYPDSLMDFAKKHKLFSCATVLVTVNGLISAIQLAPGLWMSIKKITALREESSEDSLNDSSSTVSGVESLPSLAQTTKPLIDGSVVSPTCHHLANGNVGSPRSQRSDAISPDGNQLDNLSEFSDRSAESDDEGEPEEDDDVVVVPVHYHLPMSLEDAVRQGILIPRPIVAQVKPKLGEKLKRMWQKFTPGKKKP